MYTKRDCLYIFSYFSKNKKDKWGEINCIYLNVIPCFPSWSDSPPPKLVINSTFSSSPSSYIFHNNFFEKITNNYEIMTTVKIPNWKIPKKKTEGREQNSWLKENLDSIRSIYLAWVRVGPGVRSGFRFLCPCSKGRRTDRPSF